MEGGDEKAGHQRMARDAGRVGEGGKGITGGEPFLRLFSRRERQQHVKSSHGKKTDLQKVGMPETSSPMVIAVGK